jgi:hypothetical protein
MGKRGRILAGAAVAAVAIAALGAGLAYRRAQNPPLPGYAEAPVMEREFYPADAGTERQPVRLQVVGDSLFVSYNGSTVLDCFDGNLEKIASIELRAPEPILPTDFRITESQILVADHAKGVVAIFDRTGKYLDSYGRLPDDATRLMPIALTHHGSVLYVADMGIKQVLAIALASEPGVTESGEIILSIPAVGAGELGFPSAVHVTGDGRLLVGDSGRSKIQVFTCAGRTVYSFETIPGRTRITPLGFAQDDIIDPTAEKEGSSDPSGVRRQGRFHVADGLSGQVHLFSPLGRYLASYPEPGVLDKPSSVAVHAQSGRVFVADPPRGRILVYRYGGR